MREHTSLSLCVCYLNPPHVSWRIAWHTRCCEPFWPITVCLGHKCSRKKSTLCNTPHVTFLKHDHSVIKSGPYPALHFVSLACDVMGERMFHLLSASSPHYSSSQRQSKLSNETTADQTIQSACFCISPSYEVWVSIFLNFMSNDSYLRSQCKHMFHMLIKPEGLWKRGGGGALRG